ncbi:hypothetical protein STEG23_000059 [Scotinomys teguina]
METLHGCMFAKTDVLRQQHKQMHSYNKTDEGKKNDMFASLQNLMLRHQQICIYNKADRGACTALRMPELE